MKLNLSSEQLGLDLISLLLHGQDVLADVVVLLLKHFQILLDLLQSHRVLGGTLLLLSGQPEVVLLNLVLGEDGLLQV